MKGILSKHELWDIVTTASLDGDGGDTARMDWRKNAVALYLIRESCGSDRFSSIKWVDVAKEAWESFVSANVPDKEIISFLRDIHDGNWDDFIKAIGSDWVTGRQYSRYGSNALHIATIAGHVKFVEVLVLKMSVEDVRRVDVDNFSALGLSAFAENIKIAECIIKKCPDLLGFANGCHNLIPVVLALAYNPEGIEMVRYLYKETDKDVLDPEKGANGATFVTQAIYAKAFDLALEVLHLYPQLVISLDCFDESPVQALAAVSSAFPSGNRLTFQKQWIYNILQQVTNNSSAHAPSELSVSRGNPENSNVGQVRTRESVLQQVTNNSSAHATIELSVSHGNPENSNVGQVRTRRADRGFVLNHLKLLEIDQIYELVQIHRESKELLDFMCNELRLLSLEQLKNGGVEHAIVKAVEKGIVEFVRAILRVCPDLFWSEDISTKHDLFTLAILHRQNEVFDYLCTLPEKNHILPATVGLRNILHVAAMFESSARHNTDLGAAFRMQREVKWYKEVESFVPPCFSESVNDNGQTPRELFTESHKELVKEGEKWMKETATSCTVVNALIVTIMFAAAITVPGGNNQMTGVPMFLDKDVSLFVVFIISDALSLLSASTSLLMFIGILTSRYAEEDFLKSLPQKMIIGFFTLIISLAFMMTTFCASLFLILPGKSKMVIPVVCLAIVPVALFAWMQLPLLIDMLKSTWGFRILNKKVKTG